MSRSRLDLHGQTELFEAPNKAASDLAFIAPFEVVGAEVVVRRLVFEDVVRRRHHGGRDGENGFLGSAPTFEAEKLRAQVRVPRAGRHPGHLNERRLEPGVAGARPRRETLPGAFGLPRTEAGPRHQVSSRREPTHIDAYFGDDDPRNGAADSGNG